VKLKSLRIFGFKTFAEATTLAFEPGITGVVGPNGSGKSNLVDAFRWVLGEQSARALRSARSEDVIFAGNEKRKPLGMAEVVLTFENEDGALKIDAPEVQITRRAYRGGENEYYLNKRHVRLRDVVELLMGTGLGPGSYAIVSQGRIDAILNAKPAERRSLFEETAGVNKFLSRKAESLRRLEQTERNAIRISDLAAELDAREPELETQMRRAKRYRKATERLRDLEILAYLRATATRRAEHERLGGELAESDARGLGANERATQAESSAERARAEVRAHELRLESSQAAGLAARARLADLDAQRAAVAGRLGALEAQRRARAGEAEREAAERAELTETIARLEAEMLPRERELAARREEEPVLRARVAAARAELERAFGAMRARDAAASERARALAQARNRREGAAADLLRLERELDRARAEATTRERAAAAAGDEAEALARRIAGLETAAAAADDASGAAEARASAAAAAYDEALAAQRAAVAERTAAEARLHVIEELEASREGHVPGTRAVLEACRRGEHPGIVGVVSDLVRVQERYARALDVAFGGALSNLVTTTAEAAEQAIAFLRTRELGRATFLPLDVLGDRAGRDPRAAPRAPGVVGYAHELVGVAPAYAGIVAYLVGRTLVVETLDVGVRLVRGAQFRDGIVTLEGDEIRGGGAMSGGRYRRERSILSRRAQAEGLRERIAEVHAMIGAGARAAGAAAGDRDAARSAHEDARAARTSAHAALREAQVRAEGVAAQRERAQREARAATLGAAEAQSRAAAARERLGPAETPEIGEEHDERERGALEAALAEARAEIARTEDAERAVAAGLATLREAGAAATARRDGARARLAALDADRARTSRAREGADDELARLRARGAELETERALARAEADAHDAASGGAREARAAGARLLAEAEGAREAARAAEREAVRGGEQARLRTAQIDAELGMLAAQFAQHPATEAECADVEARYAHEGGEFAAEIARLRDELARLGDVNLGAEAERDELAARRAALREQSEDIARARETLLASVHEIEAASQIAFNETFARVRTAFEAVFGRLFPGGRAKMWQTSPEALAETGIEIAVQPPGKRMTALAALSGGERAMTAAALIFALIKVRPSPFYLLDEVDAALDEANVERFGTLVRETAADAQLLLVTHNKRTMELAQRMYGVTMVEPGISSIIGASLDERVAVERTEERERVSRV